MKKINRKTILYGVIIALFAVFSLTAVLYGRSHRGDDARSAVSAGNTDGAGDMLEKKTFSKPVEIVETKTEVDSKIIEDGLTNMGFLETARYFFKDVTTTTKTSSLFGYDIGFTKANLVISYEGEVTAGINFESITVSVDQEAKRVIVRIPEAVIRTVTIDNNSFAILDESENIFNKFNVSDYNTSVVDLKANSKQAAIDRGLLDQANDNAEALIRNFVQSLITEPDYTVDIVR